MLIEDKTLDDIPIEKLTKASEKKVRAKCDGCGVEQILIWSNYIRAQKKHNRNGETFCRKCSAKKNAQPKIGKKWKKKPEQIKMGPDHPSWKGGKYINNEGYVMINTKIGATREEDEVGWARYKKEHLIIMENHLDRELRKGEVVHHINGIKTDNRIENLFLISSDREHRQLHIELMKIGYLLIQNGFLDFQCGQYTLNEKFFEVFNIYKKDSE